MNRTIISAWNGVINTGSESILKVILDQLEDEIDKENITVLSWKPNYTEEKYDVNSISHFSPFSQLKKFIRINNYILGGGDLINDLGKGFSFWLGKSAIAKAVGCNLNIFAVGVRQIKSPKGRLIAKKIIDRTETVSVRDKKSLELLKDLDVKDVKLSADPAFLLERSNKEEIRKIMDKYEIDRDKDILGISIRHWIRLRKKYSPLRFYDPKKPLKELSKVCDYFSRQGKEVVFLPTQIAPYADDRKVGEILNRISKNDIKIIRELFPPETTRRLIGQFDSYLSMRLHGIIFASLEKVPCVGITYDFAQRINQIMKEFDLSEYTLSLNKIEGKKVIEKINNSLKSKKRIEEKLEKNTTEMKKRAKKGFSLLKRSLKQS